MYPCCKSSNSACRFMVFTVRFKHLHHAWAIKRVSANTQLDHHEDAAHPAVKRDIGAIIFLATVIFSLIGIATLARNIFAAAHHLESAKRNAETVARTLTDIGVKRKAGQSDLPHCQLREENAGKLTWGPCWNEIAKTTEISALTNALESENEIFGAPCDGSEEAVGRITIEKGTSWFSAGNTGVTYAASDSEDSIATETPMRVQVCNRWGEAVKVQEIKF